MPTRILCLSLLTALLITPPAFAQAFQCAPGASFAVTTDLDKVVEITLTVEEAHLIFPNMDQRRRATDAIYYRYCEVTKGRFDVAYPTGTVVRISYRDEPNVGAFITAVVYDVEVTHPPEGILRGDGLHVPSLANAPSLMRDAWILHLKGQFTTRFRVSNSLRLRWEAAELAEH